MLHYSHLDKTVGTSISASECWGEMPVG
jgi:hypothetical protein